MTKSALRLRSRVRTVLAGTLVGGALVAVSAAGQTAVVAASGEPPNIIVIMTDDQRASTLQTMPVVRRQLVNQGISFTGIIPTSTCCPSRTSFLTGNFSHTTGVYRNVGAAAGGWVAFNASGFEGKTVAVALQSAGYRTALFGKYLNGWTVTAEDYVPPGWDEFMAIRNSTGNPNLGAGAHYNYDLTGTDPTTWYGDSEADYSTDVITDRSVDFIQRSLDGGPYFAFTSVSAPHAPFTPAPRHVGAWFPRHPYSNEAVNEQDMSDKPGFLQDLALVSRTHIDQAQVGTGQTLMAVDEGIQRILDAARPELSNTLVVFLSDNGLMWGEHRLTTKNKPYRWSTEVPLIMRWDGHFTPASAGGLGANVDVTATLLEAAGVPDALETEGISLLSSHRSEVVLEAMSATDHPAYCGVRTADELFVNYDGRGRVEYYDYRTDPLELTNVANIRSYRAERKRLQSAAEFLCAPTPPGFNWN